MKEQVCDWLRQEWTAKLVQILESMTDQQPEVEWEPDGEPASGSIVPDGSLIWTQALSGWPEPVIWVATPESTWQNLGGRTLRAAGVEKVEAADARNTWLEVLNQSLSGLAKEIGGRLRREVVCEPGFELEGPPPEVQFFASRIVYGDEEPSSLLVAFSSILVQALDRMDGDRGDGIGAGPSQDDPIRIAQTKLQPAEISKTFDLLLEVGLPVSISFGRTQMAIRDVLKLTTGSIVELNRTVMEPVEVVVNDCVIARGEVVVVEGNYGVRIRQIISRQDRLRTGTASAQRAQKGGTLSDRTGS